MRRQDGVGGGSRGGSAGGSVVVDVEGGARDLAGQGLGHGRFVVYAAAGDVDEHDAGLEPGDVVGVDDAAVVLLSGTWTVMTSAVSRIASTSARVTPCRAACSAVTNGS